MAENDVVVEVLKNGPLWIEPAVEFEIIDHEGNSIAKPEGKKGIAFCRCGASANKPFCDGSHKDIGFQGS